MSVLRRRHRWLTSPDHIHDSGYIESFYIRTYLYFRFMGCLINFFYYFSEYRIALIGVTGAGKSALGNTLLQKKAFKSECSNDSVTEKCDTQVADINGQHIVVVDTPGFRDTSKSIERTKTDVSEALAYLSPGPHVFLIVLNPSRFSSCDRDCFKDMENLFGDEQFYKHSLVVFTRRQEIYFDSPWSSITEFVKIRACPEVKDVIHKCGERVVAVENVSSQSDRNEYSENILKEIGTLVEKNKSYYDHTYFKTRDSKLVKEEIDRKGGWSCTIL